MAEIRKHTLQMRVNQRTHVISSHSLVTRLVTLIFLFRYLHVSFFTSSGTMTAFESQQSPPNHPAVLSSFTVRSTNSQSGRHSDRHSDLRVLYLRSMISLKHLLPKKSQRGLVGK